MPLPEHDLRVLQKLVPVLHAGEVFARHIPQRAEEISRVSAIYQRDLTLLDFDPLR